MKPKWKVQRLADWSRIKGTHARGMRVKATVRSQQGFGLVCDVDGKHTPAVVRNVEISWNPEKQRAATVPVGQSFTAIVMGYDEDWHEVILSIKGAEPGPFVKFVDAHKPGDVLEATVIRIIPQGYVLSLEGDIEAVLHHGEAPVVSDLCKRSIAESDALLKGDDVRVVLTGINNASQTVSVSLVAYVQKLSRDTQARLKVARFGPYGQIGSFATPAKPLQPPRCEKMPSNPLHILIVEDKDALRSQLAPALEARGHSVFTASDLASAERISQASAQLNVVLLDLQLRDGFVETSRWLPKLRSKLKNVKVYLFTANVGVLLAATGYSAVEHIDGLIQKPTEVADIIAVIEGDLQPKPVVDTTPELVDATAGGRCKGGIVLPHGIDEYLIAVQRVWGNCRPALLAYDSEAAYVEALRIRGFSAEEIKLRGDGLARSPIGNALSDRRPIEENLYSTSSNTLQELLEAISSDRVYGWPLHISSGRQAVGLFVFSPPVRKGIVSYVAPSTPHDDIQREIAMISNEMAVAIERSRLEEEIQRQQKATCVGNLILGMAHEIRNTVQTLETFRFNLENAFSSQSAGRKPAREFTQDALTGMHEQIVSLSDTLETFLGMARVSKSDMRALDEVLRDAVRACATSAHQWNVVVGITLSDGIQYPLVPATLRQAFMNLILNGIQHCAYAPVDCRLVEVTTELVQTAGRPCIDVRVCDNGLGIHRCHRSQMSEMFFTTRSDGTGLGLYVTAEILKSIGATVEIEESFRYSGTTFRVRIPLPKTN